VNIHSNEPVVPVARSALADRRNGSLAYGHPRGSSVTRRSSGEASARLEMHEGSRLPLFYAQYGPDLQKRFLGHFLKGEDTG
jgi:hypothetical protein